MNIAPIALFVYNRLEHTKRTVEALKRNTLAKDSDLIVFSDGAKNESSRESVLQLRDYLKTIEGFKSLRVVERKENFGLAKSIISGVTEVVNQYGNIIVVEDDLVTSSYFLEYLNRGLELYENNDKVISIHSYIYPVNKELPETFFLKGADCYGWATWKRGWDLFEPDGLKLLNELKSRRLLKEFDFGGSYPFVKMLKNQITGKNNSWAIRWYASAFLKDKFTLYPGKSLIYNTGFDGSGTHCTTDDVINGSYDVASVRIKLNSIAVEENKFAREAFSEYFRSHSNIRARFSRYFRSLNIKAQ